MLFTSCSRTEKSEITGSTQTPVHITSSPLSKALEETQLPTPSKEPNTTEPSPVKTPANSPLPEAVQKSGAVFEYEDNVYIYDESSGKISIVGDKSINKRIYGLSPDKQKALFEYISYTDTSIGILDLKTGIVNDIKLESPLTVQLSYCKWIDNDTILVQGHVNPNVQGYVIYDVSTRTEINSCAGTVCQVLPDGKSFLYRITPHIFPPENDNININSNEIYRVKNPQDVIYSPSVSYDMTKICFFEYVSTDRKLYFVAADLDKEKRVKGSFKKFHVLDDLKIEPSYEGDNGIDGKNQLVSEAVSGDFSKIAFLVESEDEGGSYLGVASFNPEYSKRQILYT